MEAAEVAGQGHRQQGVSDHLAVGGDVVNAAAPAALAMVYRLLVGRVPVYDVGVVSLLARWRLMLLILHLMHVHLRLLLP